MIRTGRFVQPPASGLQSLRRSLAATPSAQQRCLVRPMRRLHGTIATDRVLRATPPTSTSTFHLHSIPPYLTTTFQKCHKFVSCSHDNRHQIHRLQVCSPSQRRNYSIHLSGLALHLTSPQSSKKCQHPNPKRERAPRSQSPFLSSQHSGPQRTFINGLVPPSWLAVASCPLRDNQLQAPSRSDTEERLLRSLRK